MVSGWCLASCTCKQNWFQCEMSGDIPTRMVGGQGGQEEGALLSEPRVDRASRPHRLRVPVLLPRPGGNPSTTQAPARSRGREGNPRARPLEPVAVKQGPVCCRAANPMLPEGSPPHSPSRCLKPSPHRNPRATCLRCREHSVLVALQWGGHSVGAVTGPCGSCGRGKAGRRWGPVPARPPSGGGPVALGPVSSPVTGSREPLLCVAASRPGHPRPPSPPPRVQAGTCCEQEA